MAARKTMTLEDFAKEELKVPKGMKVARVTCMELPGTINGALVGVGCGRIMLVKPENLERIPPSSLEEVIEPHLNLSVNEIRALSVNGVPEF